MKNRNIEIYITELKEKGFSQMESITLLIEKFNFSLSEADSHLINSKAWGKKRKETIELRKLFDDELSKPERKQE